MPFFLPLWPLIRPSFLNHSFSWVSCLHITPANQCFIQSNWRVPHCIQGSNPNNLVWSLKNHMFLHAFMYKVPPTFTTFLQLVNGPPQSSKASSNGLLPGGFTDPCASLSSHKPTTPYHPASQSSSLRDRILVASSFCPRLFTSSPTSDKCSVGISGYIVDWWQFLYALSIEAPSDASFSHFYHQPCWKRLLPSLPFTLIHLIHVLKIT